MSTGAEFKGKATKLPSYYKPAPSPAPEPKQSHWPILIGGALAGAALLIYLRSNQTQSGPVLSVYPSGQADTSQIQNMQNTVNTILANGNTGQSQTTQPTPDSQSNVTPTPNPSPAPTPTPNPIPANAGTQFGTLTPGTTEYGQIQNSGVTLLALPITPEGVAQFQTLLNQSLPYYKPSSIPGWEAELASRQAQVQDVTRLTHSQFNAIYQFMAPETLMARADNQGNFYGLHLLANNQNYIFHNQLSAILGQSNANS